MASSRDLETLVNDPDLPGAARLEALRALVREHARPAAGAPPGEAAEGLGSLVARRGESNNHVHTIYSFSPYTPAMAALKCRRAGLEVAGSVDHDSIAAAPEMREACAVLGLGAVTGCELRVSFKDGPHAARKINNPDSPGLVYMTIQGLPVGGAPRLEAYLKPIRARRRERTEAMCDTASGLLAAAGLGRIDFETEVVARSKAAEGGGITERHLLAAVARRLVAAHGAGPGLIEGRRRSLGVEAGARAAALLSEPGRPHLLYDLIGLLKTGFLDRIFIQPDGTECPSAREVVALALSIGAVPAYAYLGDVGESPTGDKKAEKFEDEFLEELFEELADIGYPAVTYMPPRNTPAQLERIRTLCASRDLMEISGVDINQSRQSFNCPELRRPEFRHLGDSTWALVAHEALSNVDADSGLFSPRGPLASLSLRERMAAYAAAGRALDPSRPERAGDILSELRKGRFTR
jgi:hypothetical protein